MFSTVNSTRFCPEFPGVRNMKKEWQREKEREEEEEVEVKKKRKNLLSLYSFLVYPSCYNKVP